jgi:putative ABC transport system ATP-binding protein
VKASSVVVRSVTKTYRRGQKQITALKDVSFEMSQGELALLVGPSGSGKTTLLNLIAALDCPDHGEIIVGGSEITGLSRTAAAMLPKRQLDRRRAVELLDAVGLNDRGSHRPSELSGGEQQRVAIARALVNDPAIILADEPTGNLDDDNARKIAELLAKACRERGKTLLLVTHDRDMIHPADRIFDMRAGFLTALETVLAS